MRFSKPRAPQCRSDISCSGFTSNDTPEAGLHRCRIESEAMSAASQPCQAFFKGNCDMSLVPVEDALPIK